MNKTNLKKDYKLHISVLILAILAEIIGAKTLKIGSINIVFSPLIWSMLMMFAFYMSPLKIVKKESSENANLMMGIGLALLIAKLGVASGSQLEEI